ncbi:MAG: tyrosine-type recombinase/integrase [Bacteroidetes bacterium]|nr:tyrosine-type recombinase/integrase [Bacteroidota bacterium]
MNPTTELSFEKYLHQMRHTASTIKSYLFANKVFLLDNPKPENFTYKDVVNYLSEKSLEYDNSNTKVYLLNAMKKYFDYLVEIGGRDDHPCKNLHLRNLRKKEVIHQDLFTSAELELLMEREERYADLKQKNQVIVSLLIYQGLNSAEITALNLSHIDLDAGTVFVKASRKISQRHLELNNRQYRLFERYLNEGRKNLLREETNALILGKLGNRITVDDVHYIVSTAKGLFPDRNLTPANIRQSVIANWLNEKKIPLEQAQLMSGQKWISTTVKYRQANMEEEREMMNKWFPLQ